MHLTAKPKQTTADGFKSSRKRKIAKVKLEEARGKYLKIIVKRLLECAFSAASLICAKFRTILNDETVDTLYRVFFFC